MSSDRYSRKVRVRSCGILQEADKILLVQLHSPVTQSLIWTPPGGGVELGESLKEALKREFLEETGLKISVQNLLHINEMIDTPFHAVEFFFEVKRESGELNQGKDPEHSDQEQLIKRLAFFSREELKKKEVVPAYLRANYWKNQNKDFKTGLKEA